MDGRPAVRSQAQGVGDGAHLPGQVGEEATVGGVEAGDPWLKHEASPGPRPGTPPRRPLELWSSSPGAPTDPTRCPMVKRLRCRLHRVR